MARQGPADAEVIVVGSGPAGAATAIGLARRGRRVLLLEGRDFTRRPEPRAAEMRSGEVLSPGSQREVQRLGLPVEGVDWRFSSFAALRNRWPNGRVTLDPLPRGLAFWQTDRGRFDRALFALARAEGVDARDGCRVRDVLRDASGDDGAIRGVVTGEAAGPGRAWRAPVVVDASGRHSPMLVRLGLKAPDPEFRRVAMVCFYDWVPDCPPGVWEQHFLAVGSTALKGSMMTEGLYRFSLETDLATRDCFAARHGRQPPHATLLALLAELHPALHERFRAARPRRYSMAYAPVGYRVRRIAHDGLVLVGDAAGYLDPATGQGIEFALRSARLAAGAIDAALAAGDCRREQFAPYLLSREREFARSLAWLRLYLRISGRPAALRIVSRVPAARAALI
ncbi:MAG: NAD(P)/FAD-dependent oxidoreductase, partial [Chloroflexota bacterium]|nr:NAD(P)/FAD-dependent oxidoreductase [Chloroflexota bacterium]